MKKTEPIYDNYNEFVKLIVRYLTITLEEVQEAKYREKYRVKTLAVNYLTGFGDANRCTLCRKVRKSISIGMTAITEPDCAKCIYNHNLDNFYYTSCSCISRKELLNSYILLSRIVDTKSTYKCIKFRGCMMVRFAILNEISLPDCVIELANEVANKDLSLVAGTLHI